jgi:sugar phosphate isomerase/epimerase
MSHPPLARIRPIGLQLYTVRHEMERDVEATLARVARIGYTEVEFAGYFNRTPRQMAELLRRNHLRSPAAHVGIEAVEQRWSETLAVAHEIGHEYVVVASTPDERRGTLDAWRRIGEVYTHAGEQARAAGMGFAYHNHSYEFEPLEGRIPYDVLLESTDPAVVKLEIDLYWITAGGQDPLTYFARYPGRIPMVHVKDMTADRQMADVGAGAIDWRRIFAQRAQAGIRHYFVEHDEPADAFASIAASYRYLRGLRV